MIPVHLYVDGAPGIAFGPLEAALQTAAAEWSGPSCTDLQIAYRGSTTSLASGDGVNSIVWHTYGWTSSGFPADAAGFTDLVYERNESNEWVIVEADIHLNGQAFTWTTGLVSLPEGQRSAEVVLVHELGHLAGLLHPCGDADAPACDSVAGASATTMYPLYTGPSQATLASDDADGICFLYPGVPCSPGCPDGSACSEGQCIPTCGGTLCGTGETCVAGQCEDNCIGLACLASGACNTDDECSPDAEACSGGLCLPRGGDLGDPCTSSSDCLSASCTDGGCTLPCTFGCPPGHACGDGGICESSLGAVGAACSMGSDCRTRMCAFQNGVGTCTRSCAEGQLPCADGLRCATVSEQRVCMPPLPARCAVRTAGAPPSPPPIPLLVLSIVAVSALRVRRVVRMRGSSHVR